VVAAVAFLPFARGLLAGHSLFFRDLAIAFFPAQRFLAEGLGEGVVRYWNPYVHEGEALFPPLSYPVDLLHVFLPTERGFSLLLALHLPMGAVAFLLLAREEGASPLGSCLGGAVYALSGFSLSMVNLYVYAEALAWAPLVILALSRATRGGPREVGWAAALVALGLSTLGLEVFAQAVLVAAVVSFPGRSGSSWVRLASALALGCGLSGLTLAVLADVLSGSARSGAGFPTDVVLAHSVHPITLLQVVVGNLHGDLADLTGRWWGQNFFPRGFPYVLSLYLGATTLVVAAVGLLAPGRARGRLALLAAAALVVCVGRWGVLGAVLDRLPSLHFLRYPVKAFYTVVVVAALLAARGVDALWESHPGAWRRFALAAALVGGGLVLVPALPTLLPGPFGSFCRGFFPPGTSPEAQVSLARGVAADSAVGGVVCLVSSLIAALCASGLARPVIGASTIAFLVAADLLRTGAGLNPMVSQEFFELSPELRAYLPELRQGRVFTCPLEGSAAYTDGLHLVEAHGGSPDSWTFSVGMETLSSNSGMGAGVRSAFSPDLTMLIPKGRVFDEPVCPAIPEGIAARLEQSGVDHVLSLDPLAPRPGLALAAWLHPARIAPASVRLYALDGALPLLFVAARSLRAEDASEASRMVASGALGEEGTVLEDPGPVILGASGRILSSSQTPGHDRLRLESDRPSVVVVREAYAPGWSARVNGVPAPVVRAEGRYRAVRIPQGTSEVAFDYRPPGLGLGAVLSLLSAVVCLGLITRPGAGAAARGAYTGSGTWLRGT
jgi:hypothetical protein